MKCLIVTTFFSITSGRRVASTWNLNIHVTLSIQFTCYARCTSACLGRAGEVIEGKIGGCSDRSVSKGWIFRWGENGNLVRIEAQMKKQ